LACGPGYGLAQDLVLHRLLAEQALELADLALERPVLRRRHDLLASTRRGQRALRHQPAPCEQLVAGDPVPPRDQRHRMAR